MDGPAVSMLWLAFRLGALADAPSSSSLPNDKQLPSSSASARWRREGRVLTLCLARNTYALLIQFTTAELHIGS